MVDVDEVAERVWYKHSTCPEALRQTNIKKWKAAVIQLGNNWIATHKQERRGKASSVLGSLPRS